MHAAVLKTEALVALRRTIVLTVRASPMLCTLLLLCRIAVAVIPSAQIFITKELTDAVASVLAGTNPLRACILFLIILFSLGITAMLIEMASQYMTLVLQQRTGFRMESQLARKAVSIPLLRFEQSQYYDQLQRARSTVSLSGRRVIELLFSVGQTVLTLASFVVLLGQFNELLPLALILFVLPSLYVNFKVGQWKFWLMRAQTPHTRRMHYLFGLLTDRLSAKELRIYQLGETLLREWRGIYWRTANEQKQVERKAVRARTGTEIVQGLLGLLFAVYAVWVCVGKRLTIGHFVAVYQVMTTAQSQLKTLAFHLSSLYEDALAMREFYAFLDDKPEEADVPGELPAFHGKIEHGITVENLTFGYPASARPVLNDISLHIRPNQTVAIVGENGAGKSTLVNCLIGLYREYTGTIRYDGADIRTIDSASLYGKVAAVFQDFLRLEFTPSANIGFGDVDRSADRTALETAAARAGASDVIASLPDGYDTRLGPAFEGGTELSVGQWQKLALARSFFKDSPIIVLDEPTASMDPLAEEALFRKFAALSEGKVTFLISHRLGSCRMADQILVLKRGELVEQGTHDELLQLGGEYCRMFRTQADWYNDTEGRTG